MLARLRPLYNKIMIPLGNLSVKMGFTPDTWTGISLFLAMMAAIFLQRGSFWWGLALVIAMFSADALDGATARASGRGSTFGTVLDHVVDRYAEFIVVSGLLIGGWLSPAVAMFSTSGMVMASYVRAKAESAGGLSECTVGIAGRAEKLILLFGAVILLGLGLNVWAEVCFWIIGIISHVTAVQRLVFTRAQIMKVIKPNMKNSAYGQDSP